MTICARLCVTQYSICHVVPNPRWNKWDNCVWNGASVYICTVEFWDIVEVRMLHRTFVLVGSDLILGVDDRTNDIDY